MKRRNLLRLARLRADESGAAAVEFAIVSSVFITFVFGIAYTAIMLYTNATLQWAVETTIRQAAIDADVTQAQLTTTLNSYLSTAQMPNATVNYSVATVGTMQVATLTGSFSRSFDIPFVGTFNTTYSATAKTPQNGDS
jgi:Flp pilus assembly protein TadG